MIPWIQVYSNLISHPKTARLADILKLTSKDTSPNVVAAGMLVSLWTWAIQNAYNGDLSTCSDRTIADAARFRRKPEIFVQALTEAGWLDANRCIHDWEEHTILLINRMDRQKEKNRERVQRYRNKNVMPPDSSGNAPCNGECNVTVTKCNASTLPEPLPIPLPVPLSTAGNKTVDGTPPPQEASVPFDGKSFTRFWEAYPVKIDRDGAWNAWCALRPDSVTADEIISALNAWKASSRWAEDGGRFIPQASKFLSKEHWRSPPSSAALTAPKKRQLGEAEIEAIHRILADDSLDGWATDHPMRCET